MENPPSWHPPGQAPPAAATPDPGPSIKIPLLAALGVALLIIAAGLLLLGNLRSGYGGIDPRAVPAQIEEQLTDVPEMNSQEEYLQFLVTNIQDHWEKSFEEAGLEYERTSLVVFDDQVRTGCGRASSRTGPFYCPRDQNIYLDLTFFTQLARRYGAPGDFAQAYVIAHEYGHHVQNLLGTNREVREYRAENPDEANAISVRAELQADCYAGVWAASTREAGLLEEGDLQEGLRAAAAVGDDVILEQAGREADRDLFTHGSAAERQTWFYRGYTTGNPAACDTFENPNP